MVICSNGCFKTRCAGIIKLMWCVIGASLSEPHIDGFAEFVYVYTRNTKFSLKNEKDLVMACHPEKSKETRRNAIIQPQFYPIKKVQNLFRDGMVPRLGNGVSPCFFTFLRGGE